MRFKESIKRFTLPKGWAWVPIEDLAKLSFSSVDKKSVEGEKSVRLCNYMDVFYNRRIREGMPFMMSTASDSDIKKFTLNKGDVVLTKDSETPEEIAFAAVIDEQIDNLVCGYHLAVLRPDKAKVTGEYLMSAINFHPNHHQFVRLANGATRFGLGIDSLNNALLPLPPLAEQRKIAEILRTWDEAIETAEAELKAKQERKRGLMQRLLNPAAEGAAAVRKESDPVKLGDIAEFSKGKGLPKSAIVANGRYKCVHYGELFTFYGDRINAVISRTDDFDTPALSVEGDVLMPTSDVTPAGLAKACCIPERNVILGGDILVIRPDKKRVHSEFLSTYIRFKKKEVLRLAKGTTVFHLYGNDMAKFLVRLPPLAEQRKIAEVLQSEDEGIDSLKSKAELLRTQKRGLMQKLLTGEVRVAA